MLDKYQDNEDQWKHSCLCPIYRTASRDDFSRSYTAYMRKEDIYHRRLTKTQIMRIIKVFIEKLGNHIVESRAGVLVKRIGYFCVYRHPFIFAPSLTRHHLRNYRIIHITNHNCIFRYYMMDYKFSNHLQKRVDKKVKEGQRYLNMMMGVTSMEDMYLGALPGAIRARRKHEKTMTNDI